MKSVKHCTPYSRSRLSLVLGIFFTSFLILIGRLFIVQVARHATLQAQASRQFARPVTLQPERGRILDRHGRVLATSVVMQSICESTRD
jgi:cell division protein FtsI/penicillin-binding protein 2